MRTVRVAVVGAGPAGIYAAANLAGAAADYGVRASVDLFDRLPTPYGLVRYGAAPDHPRIKEVVVALRQALSDPAIRFFGNVGYGDDLKLSELRQFYHAVIFATGAETDRRLEIPGIDLVGSFGGADFVSWYNAHPDAPAEWPLTATEVAVIGAGNVALDICRMLAKPADEQLTTEIDDHVYRGLAANRVRDIHLFARRGPAEARFTPLELRELADSPSVDVIVDPSGTELDAADELAIKKSRQKRTVVKTLREWSDRRPTGAPRRIHLHFRAAPVAVLGSDRVEGLRLERTVASGDQMVGSGDYSDWSVQAVYRAIGYRSTALIGIPFDESSGVIPHEAGRVLDLDNAVLPGVYVSGWIKRGPVGLIGHTKSDSAETVRSLLADLDGLPDPATTEPDAVLELLHSLGVGYTTLADWDRLDAHEVALGQAAGRNRIKLKSRDTMINAGRDS